MEKITQITPLIFLFVIVFGIIFIVGLLLTGAFILSLVTRLFKFKKTNFKTALYSVLIVFGIMVAINSALSIFFVDKILQCQHVFTIIALLISFISGFFVVFKFYQESLAKCFGVWILTYLIGIGFFLTIVTFLVSIFRKGG